MRLLTSLALVVATACTLMAGQTPPAAAQPPDPAPAPGAARGLAPREIQQMIDAYVVMQAQDALALTEEQYPQFVARLRALQNARRRHQQGRNQILQELNRLTAPRNPRVDDNAVRDRLKALQEHDARSEEEIRKASEAIDQMLDVRQQARLRVFEEQMERRKIDLLMRARQGARGSAARPLKPR
jgi:hypothetical protein